MKRNWIFTQNPFWNATQKSFKKFFNLSQKHVDALLAKAGDAYFDTLYAVYLPFYTAFKNAYLTWSSASQMQKGGTQAVRGLLATLGSTDIEDWDDKIRIIHKKGTDRYKELLGDGHSPFQTGSQQARINAVATFIANIGSEVALAGVKALAQRVLNALETAHSTKNIRVSTTKADSTDMTQKQMDACTAMYATLGSLMEHFAGTPAEIENYFDMALLRDNLQTDFKVMVKKSAIKNIVKRTLAPGIEITVVNDGNANIEISSAGDKKTMGTLLIGISPGDSKTFKAEQIGNDAEHPFINVRNLSDTLSGHFEMDF